MQKIWPVFLLCILTIPAIGQRLPTVQGVFETAHENDKVYLISWSGSIDTTQITSHKFTFTLAPDSIWDAYFIECPAVSRSIIYAVFLNGDSHLNFHLDRPSDLPNISGDKNALEQETFNKGLLKFNIKTLALNEKISAARDADSLENLHEELKKTQNEMKVYCVDWVEKHKDSPFSVAVIDIYLPSGKRGTEDTLAEKCFDLLSPGANKNNRLTTHLRKKLSLLNDSYANVSSNKKVVDFVVTDTAGHRTKLSDYFNGKYVLLDFWASWCGPCRANNPMLRSLYEKFKNRNFTILGESIDTDPAKWKAAIKDDKMPWPQGSDLKGLDGETAVKYQVSAIPLYILIDPEGKVILKNLGGNFELLQSKLNELLK